MKTIRLGSVVNIRKGKKANIIPENLANSLRFIQIDDLRSDSNLKFTDSDGTRVTPDDVIIAWDGANAGTIGYGLSGIIGSTLAKIELQTNELLPEYLGRFLKSKSQYLRNRATGATIPHISGQVLVSLQIPILPLSDQEKIIHLLNEADNLCKKRTLSLQLLDEYIDSLFFLMFVKNREKRNVDLVKLENITTKITDGVHFKPVYTDSGVPFISVTNITNKKLDFSNCKFVSIEDHQKYILRCKPEYNDILYTKVGATYGRACVVDDDREFSLYVSVALIKPKLEIVNPIYLKAVLNSSFVKYQADKSVKGAGVPDLHLIEIKNFDIPLPNIDEQNEFASIVRNVDEVRQKMIDQLNRLELQFHSLMQRSFSPS